MKLEDYVKGYPNVPMLLVAEHISKGIRYSLVKEENYNTFYFMKGNEVLDRKYIAGDKYPKLAIQRLNNKKDTNIVEQIKEQVSYRYFAKFVMEQTGEAFRI